MSISMVSPEAVPRKTTRGAGKPDTVIFGFMADKVSSNICLPDPMQASFGGRACGEAAQAAATYTEVVRFLIRCVFVCKRGWTAS